jgi:hypothetical protein
MKWKTRMQHEAELDALRARRLAQRDPDLTAVEDEEARQRKPKG